MEHPRSLPEYFIALVAPFEDPIPLPDGRQLLTLKDAADYITKLPKAEHSDCRNGRRRSRR